MRTNLETPRVPPRHSAGRNCRRAAAQLVSIPAAAALLGVFLLRRSKRARHDEALLLLARELCQDVGTATKST